MSDGGYGDMQQPDGGYGDMQHPDASYADQKESAGGYAKSQSPSATYATQDAPSSTLTAGLGNGVNLQPSYTHNGNVDLGWDWMKKFGPNIKAVRIEVDPSRVTVTDAARWIKEAVAHGYTTIATYHIATDKMTNTDGELLGAASWWVTNYRTLAGSAPVTINLLNEWGDKGILPQDFADTYNKAIAKVRSVYGRPIIIDVPGSGQAIQTAALAIIGATNVTIKDRNIILSAHIYPDAWNPTTQKGLTRSDLDALAAPGLACMVGEFGDTGKGGGTDWADLVEYAKAKGWPVFGWAWNGDDSSPPMNMVSPQFQARVVGTPQKYTQTDYFKTIYAHL